MRIIYCALMILIFSSCEDKIMFAKMHEMTDGVWKYENTLSNDVSITQADQRYDLMLEINHSKTYPYENLYLKIRTEFPDQTSVNDTLSVEMINNNGNWIGKCNKENCELKIMLQQNIRFKDVGNHTITFEQFTRDKSLKGVNELNFVITEAASL